LILRLGHGGEPILKVAIKGGMVGLEDFIAGHGESFGGKMGGVAEEESETFEQSAMKKRTAPPRARRTEPSGLSENRGK
jgi:hypothetical protein